MDKNFKTQIFDGIVITHFINPHMFWFRPESTYVGSFDYLKFEEKLNQFFHVKKLYATDSEYNPRIGEIVAVYMPNWSKWIRAVVDNIVDVVNDRKKYILWAIDLGFPLQSDSNFIKLLPNDLQQEKFQLYHFAGISNVVPSEKTFDFATMSTKTVKVDSWSALAVKEFENINLKSSNITFYSEFKIGCQLFGRLELTTNQGKSVSMADIFIKLDIGSLSYTNFIEDIGKISTTKLERYMNNDGNITFANLTYNKFSTPQFQNPANIAMMDKLGGLPSHEVTKKVLDWSQQNEKMIREGEDDDADLLDDMDNFDSVSCVQTNDEIKKSIKNNDKNGTDDEFCAMKRCGRIRESLEKKYKSGFKIRPPNIPFEEFSTESNKKEEIVYIQTGSNHYDQQVKNRKLILQKLRAKKQMVESSNVESSTNSEKSESIVSSEISNEKNNLSNNITGNFKRADSISNENESCISESVASTVTKYQLNLKNKALAQKAKLKQVEEQKSKISDTIAELHLNSASSDPSEDEETAKKMHDKKRKALIEKLKHKRSTPLIPAGFDLARLKDLRFDRE